VNSVRATLGVMVLAVLLAAIGQSSAHAEGHSVQVTSPAPATLTAELYTPRGAGPFPTVILMHGCGGIGANVKAWAIWLRHEGYAAFILDSFGGRGLKSLCADTSQLLPRVRAEDVFAAAAYLNSLAQVDSGRIAAIGYSHGGSTLLTAASTEEQHPNVSIRAFILFYPGCLGHQQLPGTTPILMLLGAKDDWVSTPACEALAKSAAATGRSVTAVVYPNARHHFDGAELRKLTIVADARGGRGATMDYDPAAHEDAEKQVRAFLAAHLGK